MIRQSTVALGLFLLAGCATSPRSRSARTPEECRELRAAVQRVAPSDSAAAPGTDAADFELGAADGRIAQPIDSTAVLDSRPRILRRGIVAELMDEHYPSNLLRMRIGGTAEVELIVRTDSVPEAIRIVKSTGYRELDDATLRVVSMTRFEPGYYEGCPVRVLISFPMRWQVAPPMDPAREEMFR